MPNLDLVSLLISILVLTLSLSTHEFSHAYAAYVLGDDTAKLAGRLSMNPLVHLDPMGSLAFLIARVGWAKPVPVNILNLTKAKSLKHGMMLVSIAGPLANLFIAFVAAFLFSLNRVVMHALLTKGVVLAAWSLDLYQVLMRIFSAFYSSNISLAIFNLLPFPPLDGSKILAYFLPNKWFVKIAQYERYIAFVILLLFIFARSAIAQALQFLSTPFHWVLAKPWESLANFIIARM